MESLVLAISGPSGVGKSTVAHLLSQQIAPSVLLSADAFAGFIANGFIEQWRDEAAHQNEILGVVIAVAAMQFAEGGYTVLLDGHTFPEGFDEIAAVCRARRVPAHYVVLRADADTCRDRAASRGPIPDGRLLDELHARFEDLGPYEAHAVDANPPADLVAAEVLRALTVGDLAPRTGT